MADHPRSRGVDPAAATDREVERGSSPLARGRPRRRHRPRGRAGIIPARAGSTLKALTIERRCEDHPRSRGVDIRRHHWPGNRQGSSPLARGRRSNASTEYASRRIIPARAGSTANMPASNSTSKDHPRSRGVDILLSFNPGFPNGSSPLARGRLAIPDRRGRVERIIPARAGSTTGPRRPGRRRTDHPRSRGVDSLSQWPNPVPEGSSPLARGRRGERGRAGQSPRIIPARAGSTVIRGSLRAASRDHPRSRGVDGPVIVMAFDPFGSSPLARGRLP